MNNDRDWFDDVTDRVSVKTTAWFFIAVMLVYIALMVAWWLP